MVYAFLPSWLMFASINSRILHSPKETAPTNGWKSPIMFLVGYFHKLAAHESQTWFVVGLIDTDGIVRLA